MTILLGHGDCNLIDLVQYPRTRNLPLVVAAPWRRVLIDTGFNKANKAIAEAICLALRGRALPAEEEEAPAE